MNLLVTEGRHYKIFFIKGSLYVGPVWQGDIRKPFLEKGRLHIEPVIHRRETSQNLLLTEGRQRKTFYREGKPIYRTC